MSTMSVARVVLGLGVAVAILAGAGHGAAADVKDKVSVQIESVGLHPGMPPGMYVCAGGHLHVKGIVQNHAGVDLGKVTVTGRAFDAAGKLLGTATASIKRGVLRPNEKAPVDVEFLTVTGPMIERATRTELSVTEAASKH